MDDLGEYFETCNCDVVCPCEISPKGGLQANPTRGECDVFLAFHINEGHYGDVDLAGLNVVLVIHNTRPDGRRELDRGALFG